MGDRYIGTIKCPHCNKLTEYLWNNEWGREQHCEVCKKKFIMEMMFVTESGDLEKLKKLIKKMYNYWEKHDEDGTHKSQEGKISITRHISNYFEGQKESWSIEVYSYIFCEGRRFEYQGKTKGEVVRKAIDYFLRKFKEYKDGLK